MAKRKSFSIPPVWQYIVLGVAVAVVGVMVWSAFQPTTTPVSAATSESVTAEDFEVAEAPDLVLPDGARTIMMGDSWTAGYGADDPATQSWAVLVGTDLGLNYTLDAVSGTGYVNGGNSGQDSYINRLARTAVDPSVQLLVIQGGGNDAGAKQEEYAAVVKDTIDQAKVTYPNAQVVLIGPAPLRFPLKGDVPAMNSTQSQSAASRGALFASPYIEDWFTAENAEALIDPNKLYHPNTAGHRWMADRFIERVQGWVS